MRLRTMLILAGALMLIGAGCRECGCGGGQDGQETRDQKSAQTGAPAVPQSSPTAEQQAASLPTQPVEASSASAPMPQPVAPPLATVRHKISEPEVTEEEINDPRFNSKLPRTSRRSVIILKKLQEREKMSRPYAQASSEPRTQHDDHVKK
jgi:hypothetical protein